MRPELEEIQLLEAFLNDKLSEESELDIEIRMLWDREWRHQAELQRLSYRVLREDGRRKLRQELVLIHQRLFG